MAKLITKKEAANKIGVHINTLKSWEKQGALTPKRIGKREYYTEDDILKVTSNNENYLTFTVETWQILRNSDEHFCQWSDEELLKCKGSGKALGVRNGITCYVTNN